MPDSSVLYYLPEFAQIHVHCISDAVQPSHSPLPSSPLAFNLKWLKLGEWGEGPRESIRNRKDGSGWNFWNNRGGKLIITDKTVRDRKTIKFCVRKARVTVFCKRDKGHWFKCQGLIKDDNGKRTIVYVIIEPHVTFKCAVMDSQWKADHWGLTKERL